MPGEVVATVVPEAKPKADISNLQGPRQSGTIKNWFDRGFGFIVPDDRGMAETYIHASDILQGYGSGPMGTDGSL